MYRIVIRNGLVWDNELGQGKKNDIAIKDGKIAFIGSIDEKDDEIRPMTNIIDASGALVLPGLIDMHIHMYPLASFGTSAEASCFASGVTTTMDCGSAGAANYEDRRGIIECTRLNVKTLLNVSSTGVISGAPGSNEDLDPAKFDREKIRELVIKYKGEILGLKIRQSAEIVGELGLKPLESTVELAEELGLPVMVHCTNPPGKMDELVNLLRKGDVLTHAFMGKGDTILDESGHVSKATKEARERGVLMDVANANSHFAFFVAEAALKDGFKPDTISTDQTINSLYRRPNSYNLLHNMSKYMLLGMSLSEVISCTTKNPAMWMGLDAVAGKLAIGRPADIAIIQLVEGRPCFFGDYTGVLKTGDKFLKNIMTVKNGVIVYRDQEF